jgi:hypothetical protein
VGYKILGFLIWKVVKFYLRNRLSSRQLTALGVVAVALTALAVAGAKRGQE